MAVHCEDLNLLYLCTAKTGSTSVSSVLIEQLGGRWVPAEHIYDGDRICVDSKHSSLLELVEYGLFTTDEINSMNVVLTVRNPFAWVLSSYRYRQRVHRQLDDFGEDAPRWMTSRAADVRRASTITFDEYVRREVPETDNSVFGRYVEGFVDHPALTCLRIETIDRDLNELLGRLGVGWHITLPHENSTDAPSYREMFSPESRSVVEDVFAEELAMFDYSY